MTIVDLINEGSPDVLRQAVWACYQEEPTPFRNAMLCDPGAYPEPPLCGKITWRITHPEREPKTQEERQQAGRVKEISERIRSAAEKKTHPTSQAPINSRKETQ